MRPHVDKADDETDRRSVEPGEPRHPRHHVSWRPERAAAPARGSAAAATAAAIDLSPIAAARTRRTAYTIWMPWFFSGNVRTRWPVAAKSAFRTACAATQIVGSPIPPQNPPDGMMIDSTFGICAIRIEL